ADLPAVAEDAEGIIGGLSSSGRCGKRRQAQEGKHSQTRRTKRPHELAYPPATVAELAVLKISPGLASGEWIAHREQVVELHRGHSGCHLPGQAVQAT